MPAMRKPISLSLFTYKITYSYCIPFPNGEIYLCTMVEIFTLSNITEAAGKFIAHIGKRRVVALHGDMGAGKTTFIEEVCKVLGVKETMSSPTFSIINEYTTVTGNPVYHIDLYRLKTEEEAIAAGVEECLYSGNYCFVEWPEIAGDIFPSETVQCYIKAIGEDTRHIEIKM